MKIRVGMGFDVHKLVEDRDLWIGGIKLEHTKGLLGHSDADVLIHAICDAPLKPNQPNQRMKTPNAPSGIE